MTNIIPPARPPHSCTLPWERSGYGATGQPDGTLAQCMTCKAWWVSGPCFEHYGPVTIWRRVRWYHRRLRRIISNQSTSVRLVR